MRSGYGDKSIWEPDEISLKKTLGPFPRPTCDGDVVSAVHKHLAMHVEGLEDWVG